MNSKIAMSGLSIIASLAIMGGATFAFFSDSATSNDNIFTAGTLNLLLDDADESTPSATVSASIGDSSFAPGDSTSGFISVHNPGSLPLAELELGIDSTITANPGGVGDLSSVLIIDSIRVDDSTPDTSCVGGANLASTIDAQVGNTDGVLRLSEFDDGIGTNVYDALPGLAVSETKNVCFVVLFESTAGNEFQGDEVTSIFTFTGNQDASQ